MSLVTGESLDPDKGQLVPWGIMVLLQLQYGESAC